MSTKFFRKPFAIQGDRQEIPDDLQPSGAVSFDSGYGFDYERNPENDPLAKDVERLAMNWLFCAITENIRQYQTEGSCRYITPEQNGGNPYPYRKTARCLYEADGKLDMYESLVENNTSAPTDASKWGRISIDNLVPATRKIIATGNLTGGGSLDQDVTLGVSVPASVPPTRKITAAAPLDGGGPLTRDVSIGLQAATEGDTLIFKNGAWVFSKLSSAYELCEFYYFRHPYLRPGFQPAHGGLIQNAAALYPKAWAYLQTTEGQQLCTTEATWQALTRAVWHTNADGSQVGWNGIGGAPYFAPNWSTGALRLPDLRGMYAEAAGFDSLGVGGVHGDAIRNITGDVSFLYASIAGYVHGAMNVDTSSPRIAHTQGANTGYGRLFLNAAYEVPTAAKNQPRAWGALACVYLGAPK